MAVHNSRVDWLSIDLEPCWGTNYRGYFLTDIFLFTRHYSIFNLSPYERVTLQNSSLSILNISSPLLSSPHHHPFTTMPRAAGEDWEKCNRLATAHPLMLYPPYIYTYIYIYSYAHICESIGFLSLSHCQGREA